MSGMTALYASLRQRTPTAKLVPFREVQFKDGTRPQPNACHLNVEQWIKENPQHRPVRGWLVTSGFLLDRHSVVAGERGEFFDITPVSVTHRPPFIWGSEAEFNTSPAQLNVAM
jgi:hypothetical protein